MEDGTANGHSSEHALSAPSARSAGASTQPLSISSMMRSEEQRDAGRGAGGEEEKQRSSARYERHEDDATSSSSTRHSSSSSHYSSRYPSSSSGRRTSRSRSRSRSRSPRHERRASHSRSHSRHRSRSPTHDRHSSHRHRSHRSRSPCQREERYEGGGERQRDRGERYQTAAPSSRGATNAPPHDDRAASSSSSSFSSSRGRDRPRESDEYERHRAALPFGERSDKMIQERLAKEAEAAKLAAKGGPVILTPDMDEAAMMSALGLPAQFDSTHGKCIPDGNVAYARVQSQRQFRQYMNRKGGFNRPLAPTY